MFHDNPENPMIRGAQDAIERRFANAERQGKAHAALAEHFGTSAEDGLDAPVEWYGQTLTLGHVLSELLDIPSIAFYLSHRYAQLQTQYLVDQGALDD